MKKINYYLRILNNFKINDLEKYPKDFKSVISIILLFIIIVILLKTLFFYHGIYFAPNKGVHNLNIYSIEPQYKKFVDTVKKTEGIVLVDKSHNNNFENKEIDILISRIASRNNKVEFLENTDSMQNKLRSANSFVVILPMEEFTEDEIALLKEFVNKNGKLFLIADPDRDSSINSIATKFDIRFSQDYLYNLKENNGNFKFIILKDFRKNEITKKLSKIAFYTSCPMQPLEKGTVFTSQDTYASSSESIDEFTPVIYFNSTLALCDLTFFTPPFNSAADNNQFISNIADFLTKTDRKFNIADFPYFFRKDVDIATTNLDLSSDAVKLKNRLLKADINSNIKRGLNESSDAIFIELFDDFKAVPVQGLSVDENSFRINDLLFERSQASLVHLSKNNATILSILSDDKNTMEKTVNILESSKIMESLIDDNLAVVSFGGNESEE